MLLCQTIKAPPLLNSTQTNLWLAGRHMTAPLKLRSLFPVFFGSLTPCRLLCVIWKSAQTASDSGSDVKTDYRSDLSCSSDSQGTNGETDRKRVCASDATLPAHSPPPPTASAALYSTVTDVLCCDRDSSEVSPYIILFLNAALDPTLYVFEVSHIPVWGNEKLVVKSLYL